MFSEMETYGNGHLMYDKFTNLKDPFKNRYEITSSGEKKALDRCLVDNIFSLSEWIIKEQHNLKS